MQASPLQLEGYFLKELRFLLTGNLSSLPKKVAEYDNSGINISAETTPLDEKSRKWRCELLVETTEDESLHIPYKFGITFVGFFEVIKNYPNERLELMVKTNAPALLYSAARETLVQITGRSPAPLLILPSITFLQPPTEENPNPRKKTAVKKINKKTQKR